MRIKGNLSNPLSACYGVPQGSHLGPLLFILFINDIVGKIKFAQFQIYADDITIYHRIDSIRDRYLLQQELQLIYEWSVLNSLQLNCGKCKVLSFCRSHIKFEFNYALGANVLEEVNSIRDLGIIFESNFEIKLHLQVITSQAYRLLGFIIRSTK